MMSALSEIEPATEPLTLTCRKLTVRDELVVPLLLPVCSLMVTVPVIGTSTGNPPTDT